MGKHSKGCVCLACCAARLASPKAPDPLQGSIFEPVTADSTRSSLDPGWKKSQPGPATPITADELAGPSYSWKERFIELAGVGQPEREQLLNGSWEGSERQEAILTAHDQRRRGTLLWLREALRSLYRARARGDHGETYRLKPYVTADDAERILRLFPDRIPDGGGSWKGAIFRGSDWQFTGDLIPSVIAENNGRGQRAWRYVGS